jgi:hypothetical protein
MVKKCLRAGVSVAVLVTAAASCEIISGGCTSGVPPERPGIDTPPPEEFRHVTGKIIEEPQRKSAREREYEKHRTSGLLPRHEKESLKSLQVHE